MARPPSASNGSDAVMNTGKNSREECARGIGRASLAFAFLGVSLLVSSASAGVLAPALRALARSGVPRGAPGRVPASPFAPRIDTAGRVQVVIRPRHAGGSLPSLASLAALGGHRIRVSRLMDVIQVWLPVAELRAVAALPEVGSVGLPTYAVVHAPSARLPPKTRDMTPGQPPAGGGMGPPPASGRSRKDTGALGPLVLGMLLILSVVTAVRRRRPGR